MARKKARRRRRHSHTSVSAPRKRRKRVGYAPVIGAPRKRRRSHVSGRKHHKRRRMGASGGGNNTITEYVGLGVGTGVGLATGEILTPTLVNNIGPVGSAASKLAASIILFAVNKSNFRDNSFVKGAAIGLFGSACNDGLRALRGAGMISGPADTVIVIKDSDNGGGNMRKLNPGKSNTAIPMSGHMPVIGAEEEWHQAHVINA